MPYFKPEFQPGVIKTNSSLLAQGGFIDANLVRWWQGAPEPVGGWELVTPEAFSGKARGIHTWSTLEGDKVAAFGTTTGLYAIIGGGLRDITPLLHDTVLTDAFTTISGSPAVTVTVPFHNLAVGDTVTFANHQATVGGLTIEGSYAVQTIPTPSTFTIAAASNATSTVSTPGGGAVDFKAALPIGLESRAATGYGTGRYSRGTYGASPEADEPRVWTISNWGENGLFNPSGFGLFEWQPEVKYLELAYNGDFSASDGWGFGTGWANSGGKATKTAGTASNLSQDIDGVVEVGRLYRATFTVTRTAGSVKLQINAGNPSPAAIDVGAASTPITKSGTYSRVFLAPQNPQDILFLADSAFAGSIDNVSYKLLDKAYRIETAPYRMDAMFVDPNGVAVAVGTIQVDGTYNPNCLRCSDKGNNRDWIPDSDSFASEYILRGGGGRLMAGLATRQQNIVWGDDGVFSVQWKGELGDAFAVNLLATGCGLISRHAMAEQNGFVFWAANTKQFYIFRGLGATSLGIPETITPCGVREDVFDNLAENQAFKFHAGINPAFSEVWFFYPDKRDAERDHECSRAVSFSWIDGHFATHQIARTAWAPAGIFESPIALGLNGTIFFHERGRTANGGMMGWFWETGDMDIEDGDTLTAIRYIIPDFKGQNGRVDFLIIRKMVPNGPELSSRIYSSFPNTPRIPTRDKARSLRLRCSEAQSGTFARLGALRFDIAKVGARQ